MSGLSVRLDLADDVAAGWVLALWAMAPTPAEAARLREADVAEVLRRHRVRRVDAATVLGTLRQPAMKVAAGVTEAAVLHLRSLVALLRPADEEFRRAGRELDDLCAAPTESASAAADGAPTSRAASADFALDKGPLLREFVHKYN